MLKPRTEVRCLKFGNIKKHTLDNQGMFELYSKD